MHGNNSSQASQKPVGAIPVAGKVGCAAQLAEP